MYAGAPFGLASDHSWVDLKTGRLVTNSLVYLQRPEVVESIFYLHRLTGDAAYQDWAWAIFQAIETHTRQGAGVQGWGGSCRVPSASCATLTYRTMCELLPAMTDSFR